VENVVNEEPKQQMPRERRRPRWVLAWTILVVVIFLVVRFFGPALSLQFEIGTDIFNVIALLLVMVTWVFWIVWAFFRSGGSLLYRFLLTAVIVGIGLAVPILFQFEMTGDIKLTGVRLRSWKPPTFKSTAGVTNQIDLTKLTASDFRGFLGNNRDGIVAGKLDPDWTKNPPQQKWKIPVGDGWSGIVVVNGFALTMEQRGPMECVTCYRVDNGDQVWVHENPQRHDDRGNMGYVGPRSTPTIEGGNVYCQGATGTLMCLDGSNGKLIWKQEIDALVGSENEKKVALLTGEEFRQEKLLAWGRSISPLIVGDLVITGGGGPNQESMTTLIACNKLTGEIVWRGGDDMVAYGSPTLATIAGVPQIVITAEKHTLAVSPTDGKLLWKFSFPGNSAGDANCSQATIIGSDQVLVSKGYGRGGKLLKIIEDGEKLSATELWSNSRVLRTKLTNPVIDDGHAYSLSDGFIECIVVATGELKWKERSHAGNGQLLIVGDLLVVHSEHGELMLAKASPDAFEKLGEVKTVSGICWNTICVAGPYILVRSNEEMACFEVALSN
jgi:outer membrane protein assembly factor BamB